MSKLDTIVEFGAGAGVGALLGLIIGLSASPVVSVILGTLAGGLLVLLGFSKNAEGVGEGRVASSNSFRVFGFGIFCSSFLVVGIALRTHEVLAPSVAAQEQQLAACKTLSASDVRQVLLLKAFGLVPSSDKNNRNGLELAKGNTAMGESLPVLFAGRQDVCQVLRRDQYGDIGAYIKALQIHGGDYARLAESIGQDSPENQEKISRALSDILCH